LSRTYLVATCRLHVASPTLSGTYLRERDVDFRVAFVNESCMRVSGSDSCCCEKLSDQLLGLIVISH
jgi:hypothetical protein